MDLQLSPKTLQNILNNGTNDEARWQTLTNESFHKYINEKIGKIVKKCSYIFYKIIYTLIYFQKYYTTKLKNLPKYYFIQEIINKKIIDNLNTGESYFGNNESHTQLKWYLNDLNLIILAQTEKYPQSMKNNLSKRSNRKLKANVFNICNNVSSNGLVTISDINKIIQIIGLYNHYINIKHVINTLETTSIFKLDSITKQMYDDLEMNEYLKHRQN